jgi:hypothetical protein
VPAVVPSKVAGTMTATMTAVVPVSYNTYDGILRL